MQTQTKTQRLPNGVPVDPVEFALMALAGCLR